MSRRSSASTRRTLREVRGGAAVRTGLARTGTSLLLELLWRDPHNRVRFTWEMMYPARERAERGSSAPAIARAQREIELRIMRCLREDDARARRGAAERCIYLFANAFATDMFTGFYQIPSYTMWMATRDQMPLYAAQPSPAQLLQWRRPAQRWVMKAPSHMSHLRELFAAYPDARVVITHRDPLQVLGSLANLMASLRWTRSDHVDHPALVRAMAFGHAFLAERVMKERDAGTLPEDQILDVRYCDLVADPVGTVRRIADWRGAPLDAGRRRAIRDGRARRRTPRRPRVLVAEPARLARARAPRGYQRRYGVRRSVKRTMHRREEDREAGVRWLCSIARRERDRESPCRTLCSPRTRERGRCGARVVGRAR